MMNLANLLEPTSALIVVGGTFVGTFLRSGPKDCRAALSALGSLGRRRFSYDSTKAALAVRLRDIEQDGLLRADPEPLADRQFDDALNLLISTRSEAVLLQKNEEHCQRRRRLTDRATRTLAQAAELAPVFGLAGTLISLSQLPTNGIGRDAYMTAISMAVAATLYGLLLANLILIPIGRIIERAAADEEINRTELFAWLSEQMSVILAESKQPPVMRAVAA